ncbi:MAG: T9SS type A sorting domain-containing protein [Bacteroidota bacterium]
MKQLKKIYYISLLTLSLSFSINYGFSQTIPNHFFGENAWMPDTIGDKNGTIDPPFIFNGKLHENWKNIKNSGASIIRFGGIAADRNMPTKYQYIKMIDSIRANGMEPMIQVPFFNNRYTKQQAADIVTYINVTKGRNIKYWIIGNEPDLSYSYSTSAQIAAYFKPFASAMKNVDPSILIIGPEIASFNRTIIDGLTTPGGPNDITGKDASGRYYLDIISFHAYPFSGAQTRATVISKLTEPGQLQDDIIYLNSRIATCNSFHTRTGTSKIKTAITEANVNWQNNASDNLNGLGANSFIGGQFVAEMMCIGLKNSLDIFNLWSVVEGNSVVSNIGFINGSTGAKKPLYYHFKLLADNFKGEYVDGITNKANVKSYGSKNAQQVSVLILNQDLTNSFNYKIQLNSTPITDTVALKINMDAGIAIGYSGDISAQSSLLLTFNLAGELIRKTEYSLNGNAMANLPPTVTEFQTTGVTPTVIIEKVPFDVKNIFPNPSEGKFIVELNKENAGGKEFEVKIYNIMGQEVYNTKSTFIDGKEEIQLDPSVASGEYIMRVKEDLVDNYLVRKIVLQK